MQITVHKSQIKGQAQAPASKSYTIRGLMCAALSEERSHLIRPLDSDDSQAALAVLKGIGIEVETESETRWTLSGRKFRAPQRDLFCGDSAATLRFMTAICSLVPGDCKLTAGQSLAGRPVKTLVEALRLWGVQVSAQGDRPPVVVQGGNLKGGATELRGDISSQYVSALLLVASLADQETTIHLTTQLESRPYVLMTIQCLSRFGVEVKYTQDLREYRISPQKFRGADYKVEGDWSSASYLLALGAVGGQISVSNLEAESLQGDKALIGFLKAMGAEVEVGPDLVNVKKGRLMAIKADLSDCIDLLPTMAALAAVAEGASEFSGVKRSRLKESDRIKSVRVGLERLSIKVAEEPDRLIIWGGKPVGGEIDSNDDHRIAMAFSLIGVASGNITIRGAECVSKTFPQYWQELKKLGVKLDEQ
jgi:3-phosphoshikimate 1-carboxyvinyltransferase